MGSEEELSLSPLLSLSLPSSSLPFLFLFLPL
jgi:hypothetical protein